MKKLIYCFMALGMALVASAQEPQDLIVSKVLDQAEDTTQVVTISDIVEIQENVNTVNFTNSHFKKVWSRTSYFNIGYNNMSLTPKGDYSNGLKADQYLGKMDSDWGASLTLGHNYKLHRKAIANIVQFNLDYTYINLNANHFKQADGDPLYNSALMWDKIDEEDGYTNSYYYIPWNLEKYELNYSMELGPSITIAPFTYVNVPGLHFLKLNAYFHVGYEVSMMFIMNQKKLDANQQKLSDNSANPDFDSAGYNTLNNAMKLNWGHGMTTTFGGSISWKAIGIGFETRKASKIKYQSIQTETFGNNKYEFEGSNSRIYLQIRY